MNNKIVNGFALGMCALMLVGCNETPVDNAKTGATEAASEEVSAEAIVEKSSEESDIQKETVTTSGTENNEQVKKCLEGYVDYLENHEELWKTETVYVLDYINDDDIPDLIFGDTFANHASNIYILTYLDGNYDQVVCCGAFGSYGATCYYPRLGIMLSSDMGMGYDSEYYSELTSEKEYGYKTICHRYFYYEEDYEGDPAEIKFFIGENEENEVSQEEYDEYVKSLIGDTEYIVFYTYNNDYGYEYLTQDALDNTFGW